MRHRLTEDLANALVTLDWIRERLVWYCVSDRAAYQSLRLKGVCPKTGTAYRRGDVERAYKLTGIFEPELPMPPRLDQRIRAKIDLDRHSAD